MEHFRLRKYRGKEIWARVREAYVAGEPGPQVAKRFDVGLANLRKKASREGWTRTANARAGDPLILATQPAVLGAPAADRPSEAPSDPASAFEAAMTGAAAAIAQGRGGDAQGLLRAAETLSRLRQENPPDHLPTPQEWAEQEAVRTAAWEVEQDLWRAAETERLEAWASTEAMRRAKALLSERGYPNYGDFALSALHWRARHLGPEQGLIDLRRGIEGGWSDNYWDADGRLHPIPEAAAPSDRMWRQHVGGAQGVDWSRADMSQVRWPPATTDAEATPQATDAAEVTPNPAS